MPEAKQQHSTRAKFRCPDTLAEWLRLVNLVEPEYDLPEWEDVLKRHREANGRSHYDFCGSDIRATFDECLGPFPEEMRSAWFEEHLMLRTEAMSEAWIADGQEDGSLKSLVQHSVLCWTYSPIRDARNDLRDIARFFQARRRGLPVDHPDFYTTQLPHLVSPLEADGTILRVPPSNFAAAIHGVDGDRIRLCAVCNRLFWARRKSSETDTSQCLNILHQRRHRERGKEKIDADNARRQEIRDLRRAGKVRGKRKA